VRTIHILPLGGVAPDVLDRIAASARERFDCGCEVLPISPMPASSYRGARNQYDADELLEILFERLPPHVLRLVGVCELDLFAEGRNFVFGYAHMRDRVAVFSTLRLHDGDATQFVARVDKALTHELGHTFHAPHCEQPACVMHQVEFLWQLDELPHDYCASCDERISQVAFVEPSRADKLFEHAGAHMRRRRFARAAAVYAEACAREPHFASYHNDHGVALLATGDHPAATRAFERAAALSPGTPHAYYNLGIVARERGDVAAADAFFAEALARERDPRAAHRYLGVLHQDYFHDAERARTYLSRYRALGGEDVDVRRRLETIDRAARRMTGESALPI
jgi:archaemetzincin